MMISVLMMCAGSLLIAILPTYATIGTAAPILLLFARLVQGLSVGGEYGTAATYMSEVATQGRRGFYASFQYVTLIGGQLLALLVLVTIQQFLSTDELKAWGWRIPFVIGALAALVALYLRRSLAESASSDAMHSKEAGIAARPPAPPARPAYGAGVYRRQISSISTRLPPTCKNTWSIPRILMPRRQAR